MEHNVFYMPGEWEEHERTLIEWPVKDSLVWPENYEEVCKGYEEVIRAIAEFEPVTVIANDSDLEELEKRFEEKVHILRIPHNDAWCRDNGPTFVWNNQKELKGISWKFNAWGEKYVPYELDDKAALVVLKAFSIPSLTSPIVLEGGSIHVDGEGTMLTTKQCLLNENRNPNLQQEEIETEIKDKLKIEKIIWLNQGLYGDETDGHIDNIACFARPGEVFIQTCKDKNDPNYEITLENLEILEQATDAKGRKLKLIEIPQPPVRYYNEIRLTLSYLNFYFVNKGIVLPVFGGDAADTDKKAQEILQEVYPDRKIVTIDGMALIKEGGNVHCITQQMPAGKY